MLDIEYIIFCEFIDHTKNGTNLVNVFDLLHASEFPVSFGTRLVQVAMRAKKPIYGQDVTIKLTVEHENTEVFQHTNTLKDVKALKDYIIPVDIDGLERLIFQEPGKYYFKFYVGDELKRTRILDLRNANE